MANPNRAPIRPSSARAVELARTSGLRPAQVARDLGIDPETLRLWFKQAAIDAGENAVRREERALLKQAAALFAAEGATR